MHTFSTGQRLIDEPSRSSRDRAVRTWLESVHLSNEALFRLENDGYPIPSVSVEAPALIPNDNLTTNSRKD